MGVRMTVKVALAEFTDASPGRILRGGSRDIATITLTVERRSCKQHYKVERE